jgi:hypothetical protein
MIGIDPPDPVVQAIVRTAKRPREEVLVGWKSRSAYWAHRLAPDLTERTAANITHRVQMVDAPPSPATSGAVFTPKSEATRWRVHGATPCVRARTCAAATQEASALPLARTGSNGA